MFHVKCKLRDSKSNKRLNLKKLVSVIGYETREEQRLAEANALTGLLKSISKLTIFLRLLGLGINARAGRIDSSPCRQKFATLFLSSLRSQCA